MSCKQMGCDYPAGECSGACATKPGCPAGTACHGQPGCQDTFCPGHPGADLADGQSGEARAEEAGFDWVAVWVAVWLAVVALLAAALTAGAADGLLIWMVKP